MKSIRTESLVRGKALVDYALSKKGRRLSDEDMIGVIAAYLGRGSSLAYMMEDFSKHFGSRFARRAEKVLNEYNNDNRLGLWETGAGDDEIRFTHEALCRAYPIVNINYHNWAGGLDLAA